MADLLFILLLVAGAGAVVHFRGALPLFAAGLMLAPLPAVLAGHLLGGSIAAPAGDEGAGTSFWLLAAASYLAVWAGVGTGFLVSALAVRSEAEERPSSGKRSRRGEAGEGPDRERPRRRRPMGAPLAPRRGRESRPA